MRRILILLLFIASQYVHAQQVITGIVVDASDNKPLVNASVVVLNTDSIMQQFARVGEDGKFQIKKVARGKHLLLVTYPKFEIFSKEFEVASSDIKLDSIKINSQSNLLEEIIVTQKIPIKMKGDTIEYDASSFATEKNAKLEDLLRRLPGLTVSNSGEVTAHGKTVSKVLIDGEEFFGYDPKIAIRNVRADAVDKVQVYERKSEQAELTGIDDGVRLQTVNVVLKEEARKGIFGNANASVGTKELFDANLFAAKFNQSERIGLTGSWNNMGNQGDASMIRMNNQIIGKPEHQSAGINYENNFLKKKLHMSSSYGISNNSNANESESYNKQVLGEDKTQETSRKSQSENSNLNNNLRAQFRMKIDSVSNMNVHLGGSKGRSESSSLSSSETFRNEGLRANEFNGNNSTETDNGSLNVRMDYRRRLNQKGRSMNLHLSNDYNNSESTNLVDETTKLYDRLGNDSSTIHVNQTRLSETKSNGFGAALNFSEPISERLYLTLGYSFNTSKRTGLVDAYNNTDNTQGLDMRYSKNEEDKNNNNSADVNLSYRADKFNINLSNRTTYRQQQLSDSYRDIDLERSFWQNNFNTNISYKISNSKNLTFGFQNNTNVPSFQQLQPLQPPTNELYEQIGNPDLKREINNNFNLSYNRFSLLKGSSFNVNGSVSLMDNAIVNKSVVDDKGKTTATFVNINDKLNWNARLNANYGKPIFNGVMQFGPYSMISYNSNYLYINGDLNQNITTNANIGVNGNKQSSKGVDFNFNLGIGLVNEQNSVQTRLNNTSLRSSANADLKYYLPFKFSLTQVLSYSFTGKNKIFPEPIHQFYMNLELTRKLLSSESLLLSVKAFDVFNSFNNTQRSFSESNFSETRQQMLTQYFMVGLKWDFNKNLGKKND